MQQRVVRADAVGPASDHHVAADADCGPREGLPLSDPARHALPALCQHHSQVTSLFTFYLIHIRASSFKFTFQDFRFVSFRFGLARHFLLFVPEILLHYLLHYCNFQDFTRFIRSFFCLQRSQTWQHACQQQLLAKGN